MFTRIYLWSLSCARWCQSTPIYPLFNIHFNITSHLCQVLPIAFGFMTNFISLCFPCMHSTCLVHLIILDCLILIIHDDNFTVLITLQTTELLVLLHHTCNTAICPFGLNNEECQRKYCTSTMVDHFRKPFRSQTSKILNFNSENHIIVLTFQ